MRQRKVIGILIVICCFMIASCGAGETIIKDRKIEITIAAIKDSLPAVYKEIPKAVADTLHKIFSVLPDSARFEAEKDIHVSTGRDKSTRSLNVKIKYFPKKKSFTLEMPSQKIDTTITDTTKLLEKNNTTTPEKFGYATYGIIVFLFVCFLVFLSVRLGWLK